MKYKCRPSVRLFQIFLQGNGSGKGGGERTAAQEVGGEDAVGLQGSQGREDFGEGPMQGGSQLGRRYAALCLDGQAHGDKGRGRAVFAGEAGTENLLGGIGARRCP